jgi:MFS family permease
VWRLEELRADRVFRVQYGEEAGVAVQAWGERKAEDVMVTVPIGWLADRWSRRAILSAGITLWCAMTCGGAFVRSFLPLFGMRLGVGLGEAVPEGDWFCEACEREALYVIALAQVEADADRQRFAARDAERKTRARAGVAAHEEGVF